MSVREDPATPSMHPRDGQLARNGATGTVIAVERRRPRRYPVGRFSGRKLDLLIRDFARFIHSEVAMLCQTGNNGQPPAVIAYSGPPKTHEEITRQREGGLVVPRTTSARARSSNRFIPSSIRDWCTRPTRH